jgi:hypothetical protein
MTLRRRFFRRPRRRGVFLIELLGMLVILGTASILAGQLLVLGLRMMNETRDRSTLIGRVDSAMDALRRDAWAADSAKLAGDARPETGIQLRLPVGDVVWQMNGGTLTRTDASGSRKWIGMPSIQFAIENMGVRVEVKAGPNQMSRRESLLLATPRMGGKA